jgi:hypothetical protein
MGQKDTPKAKLFAGILFSSEDICERAIAKLEKRFGEIDNQTNAFKFVFTDYYAEEMGHRLKKRFVTFKELIDRGTLPEIKLFTIRLEEELALEKGGKVKRQVNIDPGYITDANLVLATTKDRQHRIYLRDGIFAEVTLGFKKDRCIYFDWTYPDFKTPAICNFFLKVRR